MNEYKPLYFDISTYEVEDTPCICQQDCIALGRYKEQPCWGQVALIDKDFWNEESERANEDWIDTRLMGSKKPAHEWTWVYDLPGWMELHVCQGHRRFGEYTTQPKDNQ